MSAHLYGLSIVAVVIGMILVIFGGKKQAEAKDYPAQVQWGALAVIVGLFGILSEYMSFTATMLVFVVVSGLICVLDYVLLRPQRRRLGGESNVLLDYSRGFFPVILLVFLFRAFLVEPFTIPSSSMRPGLIVGDFILVNKFTYGIRLPVLNTVLIPVNKVQRGDVIVFSFPLDTKINYIKRVVGLPGDIVEFRNKRLTINGQSVPDVAAGAYDYQSDEQLMTIHNQRFIEKLDGKQYAVLNTMGFPTVLPAQVMDFQSRDKCRYDDTGFICTVPAGQYFMMGDNRDGSLDSRYWGFVDDSLLIGKAFMIWLNFSQLSRIGTMVH